MIVVSDTSSISALILIGRLEILNTVFGEIIIPPIVFHEIMRLEEFSINLSIFEKAGWIQIQKPVGQKSVQNLMEILDPGESEAIVLAQELNADFLLIDERLGSQMATDLGIPTVGLLGTLLLAKKQQPLFELKPILKELKEKARFRMSLKVMNYVLRLADEPEL